MSLTLNEREFCLDLIEMIAKASEEDIKELRRVIDHGIIPMKGDDISVVLGKTTSVRQLLGRKRVTKEYLQQFLSQRGVDLTNSKSKKELIEKALQEVETLAQDPERQERLEAADQKRQDGWLQALFSKFGFRKVGEDEDEEKEEGEERN